MGGGREGVSALVGESRAVLGWSRGGGLGGCKERLERGSVGGLGAVRPPVSRPAFSRANILRSSPHSLLPFLVCPRKGVGSGFGLGLGLKRGAGFGLRRAALRGAAGQWRAHRFRSIAGRCCIDQFKSIGRSANKEQMKKARRH